MAQLRTHAFELSRHAQSIDGIDLYFIKAFHGLPDLDLVRVTFDREKILILM